MDDELKIVLNEREKAQVVAAISLAALGGFIPKEDAWDILNAVAASYPEERESPSNLYPIPTGDKLNGK